MSEIGLAPTKFAADLGISDNTLRGFLENRSWPIMRTQRLIEDAIDWPAGAIEDIARGGDVPGAKPARALASVPSPNEGRDDEWTVREVDDATVTVINGAGLVVKLAPREGKSVKDVLGNLNAVMAAITATIAELPEDPGQA